MDKKILRELRYGSSSVRLLKVVFELFGLAMILVGIMVWLGAPTYTDNIVFGLIFSLAGLLFYIIGWAIGKGSYSKSYINKLIKRGDYVVATITGVFEDSTTKINENNTFIFECEYYDGRSTRKFVRKTMTINPVPYIRGDKVKVYLDRKKDRYHIDIASAVTGY